jgi:flagellin-like hook-associated protein FlgL
MSSGITLTAAVRQNLLSLQNTADLMATTQQRLATGKKVNSALDNPSNFFTSQSLNDRASDLNALLDSIGQATQTLDAANNGITSITQLVQSAKSIAQQARQSTGAVNTYSAVDSSSNILSATNLNGSESVATSTGSSKNLEAKAIAITGATITETTGTESATTAKSDTTLTAENTGAGVSAGNVVVSVTSRNGSVANFTVALSGQKTQAAVKTAFNTATATVNGTAGVALSSLINVTFDGSDHLTLTAANTGVDFKIQDGSNGSTAATLTDLGLTGGEAGAQVNSSSLFDQFVAASGAEGNQLTISGTNSDGTAFTSQTITFGTGASEVNTLADLNTKLAAAATASSGGFSASVVSGAISITKAAGTKSSVTVGGSAATFTTAATFLEGATAGTVFSTHNSQPTLADEDSSLSGGGSLSFTLNGQNFSVGVAATDRVDDVIGKLNSSSLASSLTFSKVTDGSGHDHIKIAAKDSSVDFTVNANTTSAAVGLTTDSSTSSVNNSTDVLNLLNHALGGSVSATDIAQGKTLTVTANGGAVQTITFGTGTGQVQTVAQLNSALTGLSNVTGSVTSGGALDINIASGTSATSLTIGGTAAGSLGLTAGTQSGTVISTTSDATRASLQNDFNNVLDQIDALSKDASYNGINLLNGDDLKVSFNETGSSSLTIKGVTFDSNNLGLAKTNGTQFQDNTQIDTVIAAADTGLNTLRTQASKFGSNLTTVQTRQDFTKNMINTLQTGADNLVLADSNEEGANMLALQTRQQLSTTALSLANQASQAVLRLFG